MQSPFKNFKRYQEIIQVLLKYGFGDLLDQLGLDNYFKSGLKLFTKKTYTAGEMPRPVRVRKVLEELGPTFVKLGQMISVNPTLVPSKKYLLELQKLQDKVPPFPGEKAKKIIEDEFEEPIDEIFLEFEKEAHAAASLAQVHKARLQNGEQVVVKIQRPNIKSKIESDLDILNNMANIASNRLPKDSIYRPVEVVNEFKHWIHKELNFIQERRNIERFKNNFQNVDTVYIPQVYRDYCSSKIVTMEYIDGIRIDDVDAIQKSGLDREKIAHNGMEASLRQVFEHGFFHGDPHPGNIFVLEDNVIAPMDFGLMGNLTSEHKEELAHILNGIVNQDVDRIIRVFFNMGIIEDNQNIRELKIDLSEMIGTYYRLELQYIEIEQIVDDITQLVNRYKIRLPKTLFLMIKSMYLMEGIARDLYPEINMIEIGKPYIKSFMMKRWSPNRIFDKLSLFLADIRDLMETSPTNLKRIMLKLRQGDFSLTLHHEELTKFIHMLDKASNRISFSLIIAALIIASSVMVNFGKGPTIFGIPAIGLIGYVIATIMGLWLVISIIRSGRM